MSEIAIGGRRDTGAFDRGAMLLIVAVGVLAFVAMLVLGAYAPGLRSGRDGGTHALSNAATGYSGLVQLAEATGRKPMVIRSEHQLGEEPLAVITPPGAASDLSNLLAARAGKATLIVLPKWATEPDEDRPGWIRSSGLLPPSEPNGILAPAQTLHVARAKGDRSRRLVTVPAHAPATLRFREPHVVQTMAGPGITPVITDRNGRIVLGQVEQTNLFVLADPDLLNNRGMADKGQAAAALDLLDFLNSTDADGILFDVTANGLGHSRSPLRLAFDPPFLAVTVAIFVALLLAGLQGITRFGAPRRPVRAIAFGKKALVDNSAALIRRAGREAGLGARYADVVRDRARSLFGLAAVDREGVEALDRINAQAPFTPLARAAETARTRTELLYRAQALHRWLEERQ